MGNKARKYIGKTDGMARGSYFKQRHPFVVPVLTFLVLFFGMCFGLIFSGGETVGAPDTKVIKLSIDGKSQTVPTRAETVKDFLKRAGIELHDEDVVEPMPNTPIAGENFSVNVFRARLVTVTDEDGKKITARIAESTPEGLAKKAGINVYPEDNVTFAPSDEALNDGVIGSKVVVDRATLVHVNLYGNGFQARTHAQTVGDLLREKDIKAIAGDSVLPSPETAITNNLQIFVIRSGKQITTIEEIIAPPVENRPDATLDIGRNKVVEPGAPGKRLVTYEIDTQNGRESGRKEIQSVIVQEPRKRIMIVGAKKNAFSGSFDAALARLRSCEGSYTSNTGNGYYGAYQYDIGTWNGFAGYPNAAAAPPYVQDQKAWETYQRRGWQPWPSCSRSLGLQDIYR